MLGSEAGGAYALVYACAAIGDKVCKGKGKSIRGLGGVPSPYHALQKDLRRVKRIIHALMQRALVLMG